MANRAMEITREVHEFRNFIWDAYDQGRWAHAMGFPRSGNPHIEGHANYHDWFRGYDNEASR